MVHRHRIHRVNKIQAGNLDVKLMYSTDMQTWKEATDQTKLFDDNALWEPGYTGGLSEDCKRRQSGSEI